MFPLHQSETHKHSQTTSRAAQNFAADLDSMFGLSGGTAALSQHVEEKYGVRWIEEMLSERGTDSIQKGER